MARYYITKNLDEVLSDICRRAAYMDDYDGKLQSLYDAKQRDDDGNCLMHEDDLTKLYAEIQRRHEWCETEGESPYKKALDEFERHRIRFKGGALTIPDELRIFE